jgi:glutamate N-acetyltransferase/amino-acid N-acetyltransferase
MKNPYTWLKGGITAVPGFRAAGVRAGIKKGGRLDLALIFSEKPCTAAGVFTTNRYAAAPVLVTRDQLKTGRSQAIVVNSGGANACTGEEGYRDAMEMLELASRSLGIASDLTCVGSTGVIGRRLPMDKIRKAIPLAARRVRSSGGLEAAKAIMTTDTVPKLSAVKGRVGNRNVTVGGIAKGAGMVHPSMATLLGFLGTDAQIEPAALQAALRRAVDRSFNRITIDGDTSTNDMVLCLANGMSGIPVLTAASPYLEDFQYLVEQVCVALAKMVAKDGEGAETLVEVIVRGALTESQAESAAKTIAGSLLVKTAIYGEDANWGRILAALGRSGVGFDPRRVDVAIGPVRVVAAGVGVGPEAERRAAKVLARPEVQLTIDLHAGFSQAAVWTCDLGPDYVKINAAYRS